MISFLLMLCVCVTMLVGADFVCVCRLVCLYMHMYVPKNWFKYLTHTNKILNSHLTLLELSLSSSTHAQMTSTMKRLTKLLTPSTTKKLVSLTDSYRVDWTLNSPAPCDTMNGPKCSLIAKEGRTPLAVGTTVKEYHCEILKCGRMLHDVNIIVK